MIVDNEEYYCLLSKCWLDLAQTSIRSQAHAIYAHYNYFIIIAIIYIYINANSNNYLHAFHNNN